jgi:glycosyltransferase involved in cell wall biosynthesis
VKKRFIFLNSHPIQYFAPLYQQMAQNANAEVEVLYCSDQGVSQKKDEQFGQVFQWDIPLLKGYQHVFLKNYARRPHLQGFWGLQNWGLIAHLIRAPKSILVINGWQFFIYVVAIIVGRLAGHKVCLRMESPISRELQRSPSKQRFRRIVLGGFLFRWVHYFLYIGQKNRAFYKFMGVPDHCLVFAPYSVDNQRFQHFFPDTSSHKNDTRQRLQLPGVETKIVLYSGKFMAKKRPLDLLQAWEKLKPTNAALVFMGDGALRPEMEAFIAEHKLQNVMITGFVNQADIPLYYAAADIYVMLSDTDETWGLSTNEAMNLRLPLIVSEAVGCASDLVESGKNGFVYPLGDIQVLSEKLDFLLKNDDFRLQAGQRSFEIVNEYSYDTVIKNLLTISPN